MKNIRDKIQEDISLLSEKYDIKQFNHGHHRIVLSDKLAVDFWLTGTYRICHNMYKQDERWERSNKTEDLFAIIEKIEKDF